MQIHTIFEAQVARHPEATALTFEGQIWSYRQLNARANQLARHLAARGARGGRFVALFLDRSPDMIAAILAVLKTGAAYVPMDLSYPANRLASILEDTEAPLIITTQALAAKLPPHSGKIVELDGAEEILAAESESNLELPGASEDPAYVIFTSGSTGKPKGVVVTHHNVLRLFQSTDPWFGFKESDVWTLFHSYAFDFSVWEIWGALLYGGRLVIVPYAQSRSPESFYRLLCREEVTVLNQTPSAFRQLAKAEEEAGSARALSLRYVIFGGEALVLESLRPWLQRHGDAAPRLINMYGITETTVHVTYRPVRLEDLEARLGSMIGEPIPDLEIWLLDENLQPVAPGCPGEICVSGAGVALGYLKRPELTREKFVSHQGQRLYRSGDLARWHRAGDLEYLGRKDSQVKVRGFRIELGEIETALQRHAAVRECVVMARPEGEELRLAAYVVARSPAPSVSELRQFLAGVLPEYMIPAAFVFLDALPLTGNGKIDRTALPEPEASRPALSESYVAPANADERTLAEIWKDVLELDRVGVHDSFFDLGGDSIRSIRVLSRAQQAGLNFSMQDLFNKPTIQQLLHSGAKGNAEECPKTEPFSLISADDRCKLPPGLEDAYPMIHLQGGMLYHSQLNPASAVFHDVFSFRLQCPFSEAKLRSALDNLSSRHPILRTAFDLAKFSQRLQLVHRTAALPFSVEDLSQANAEEQRRALENWIETEKYRPFDFSAPPLWRCHAQIYGPAEFQFIISFHHAILDGWSLAALMTELIQEYADSRQIAPPRIAYREFVALEQKELQSADARRFWSEKLKDSTPQIIPRWPKKYRSGGTEQKRSPEFQIPPEIFAGLNRLARAAGVPLRSVLLAAHLRVMNLLTAASDITTGLVSNGRPEAPDGERMIGLFLNTIPFRLQLEGGAWLELVKQTFVGEREIIPFRRYPLSQIQHDLGGEQLFETAFDFVHFHVYRNLTAWHNSGFAEGHYFEANNFTLLTTFMLDVTSTRLQMHMDYDPEHLALPQVELMGEYYLNILAAMTREPSARYETLSPLPESEQTKLVREWNDTEKDFPREILIHQLFEKQVKKTPDAIAVMFDGHSFTYDQINHQANRLANHLRGLGLNPGEYVAVCMSRAAEMVPALLGILKAGCAYLPLEPEFPTARLHGAISAMNARCVITQTEWLPKLLAASTLEHLICLDAANVSVPPWTSSGRRIWRNCDLEWQSSLDLEPLVASTDAAYVIFTSGSTGAPKGVMVSHRPVINLIQWVNETFCVNHRDCLLFVTSLCFDLSVYDIFGILAAGGTIRVAAREELDDPERLVEIMRTEPITFWDSAPAALQQLVPFLAKAQGDGANLRRVFLSGDWIPLSLPNDVRAAFPNAEVISLGGATEATVWSNFHRVQKIDPEWKSIPYGRPIPNARYYILDAQLNPSPTGVPGDLFIGGECLADGYNDEALTRSKFVPDPFRPGARLYRTGDVARFFPDGNIEFLGRRDQQVKIRGYRIELGEIEAALRKQPAVKESIVVAREDAPGEKRLVAYVIAHEGATPDAAAIRCGLARELPDYMLPAAIVFLERMPMTANGKLDRRALPAPRRELLQEASTFVAPRTPAEAAIAAAWRDVLTLDQVGVEDNFFDLGGNSLSAIQLITRLRDTLSLEIPLRLLFDAPTVAAFAAQLPTVGASPAPAINVTKQEGAGPLSSGQNLLWIEHERHPSDSRYNVPQAWEIQGPLNVDTLKKSLLEIIARHEILRATYRTMGGEPRQEVHPGPLLEWKVLGPEPMAEALHRETIRAFDLNLGPIVRATVFRLEPERHVFLVVIPHLAFDGWSHRIFMRELSAIYSGHRLPNITTQYRDFAVAQRKIADEIPAEQIQYWRNKLAGESPLLQWPNAGKPGGDAVTHAFQFDSALWQETRAAAVAKGYTTFMLLLAAFKVTLSRFTGQINFAVGSPMAGRDCPCTGDMIGYFINLVLLRTDLSGNPTFQNILERVRETALGALENRAVPFEKLLEIAPQTGPLCNAVLGLQPPHPRVEIPGLQWNAIEVPAAATKFDLTFALFENEDSMSGTVEYPRGLFDAATIEALTQDFENIARALIFSPDQRLSDNSYYPREACIHELFEAQVARAPEAVALTVGNTNVTYRQLNERADLIAAQLRQLGIKPNNVVGICIERSVEMIAGLVGILKAGGAYLPLDASYPRERLAWVIADAHPAALLTRRDLLPEQSKIPVIYLDEPLAPPARQTEAVRSKATDFAYVMYTSGSTGRPKAAAIPHRGVVRLVRGANYAHLSADEVFLQFAPISFDASTFEIWASLLNGARLVLFPPRLASLEELGATIRRHKVTTLLLTSGVFHQMVEHQLESLRGLHQLLAGGDVLSPSLVLKVIRSLPDCDMINVYGPTENTTFTTCHTVPKDWPGGAPVPIGRPVSHTQVYILDSEMKPVPRGQSGELYTGGDGLAREYLNAPELTAQKFVPNPFSAEPGVRLYRTGDLVRQLEDGTYDFIGRMDRQVKIRGFRIELGEIEATLGEHPDVGEVVVLAREDRPGEKSLAAYVSPRRETNPRAADLEKFLKQKLPSFMIPAHIVLMPQMPLTANGKIDRDRLPSPDVRPAAVPAAPHNPEEELLVTIWSEVLGRPVGVNDNFFDLGGHSLLATKVVARISRARSIELPLRVLFEAPTIAALARELPRCQPANPETMEIARAAVN